MDCIKSRHNPVFKSLVAAKKERGLLLLEGRRLVEDALSRGMVPKMVAMTPGYTATHGSVPGTCAVLDESLFAQIADTVTPQGVIAFFDIPWAVLADVLSCEKMLILDSLQDPGNVGTIIRTAEAFGFPGIVVTPHTASPFSPKAVRSSMGSCLGVRIAKASVSDLKVLPHRIISLALDGEARLSPQLFEGKVAICLGQEGAGLSQGLLNLSHQRLAIPMKGPTESLNVAVAAGIVMAYACGVLSR